MLLLLLMLLMLSFSYLNQAPVDRYVLRMRVNNKTKTDATYTDTNTQTQRLAKQFFIHHAQTRAQYGVQKYVTVSTFDKWAL